MILVTDVYYREADAKTVGLLFQEWADASVGIDTAQAASFVEKMHGNFRIPTLLKLVDQYSREI
ncbi:MAG: hypothetical protein LUE98_06750 [Tannerellaceae bacterium]|nr:hypothetical protein [Tannerellaceae bacterium]